MTDDRRPLEPEPYPLWRTALFLAIAVPLSWWAVAALWRMFR